MVSAPLSGPTGLDYSGSEVAIATPPLSLPSAFSQELPPETSHLTLLQQHGQQQQGLGSDDLHFDWEGLLSNIDDMEPLHLPLSGEGLPRLQTLMSSNDAVLPLYMSWREEGADLELMGGVGISMTGIDDRLL